MAEKFTVELLVSNTIGILNRVAGLYGRRGLNISTLMFNEINDSNYSKMTVVSTACKDTQQLVVKQLERLYDVKKADLLQVNA